MAPGSAAPLPEKRSSIRLENVQALRGVAVLLVMLFHLHGMESIFVKGWHVLPDGCRLGRGGVDLFFAISGVVMAVSTHGRFGRARAGGRFLLRRALRIYPLYWLYSLVTLSVFLLPQGQVSGIWTRVDLSASFLLWPQEIPPLLGVGWTLWHELYFYTVFALLMLGKEEALLRRLWWWAVLAVAGGWLYWLWPTPPAVSVLRVATDPLTVEFIAGCLLGRRLLSGGCRRWGWQAVLLGSVLFALQLTTYPEGLTGSVPDRWIRVVRLGIPAWLVLYGVITLELGRGWLLPRWLIAIGYASYSIYLSHTLLLAVGRRAWFALVPAGYLPGRGILDAADNVLAFAVLAAVALLAGLASYRFIEAPLLAAVRRRLRPQL